MQVTKELIESDIAVMQQRIDMAKASLAEANGALAILQGIKTYLEAPEPEPAPVISNENAAIQDVVEAQQLPVVDLADPVAAMVVDARGQYQEVKETS